jgi:lipopolysaccharide export LptBFGC system permease protein LptF
MFGANRKISFVWISMLFVISVVSGQTERWVYTYDGPAHSFDYAYDIIYGDDGNIYIAGYSTGIGTGTDFAVISLDTAGTERWVYQYNGSGNSNDIASAIVSGDDGNVYAAGYITNSTTQKDFVIISLTTAGDTNWIYSYNGPGNMYDEACAIAYGLDGNIYAAGYSYGITTYKDFTVISLTTSGSQRWVYRHNGIGNGSDEAYSIAYGADNNVYAAGYDETVTVGSDHDFTVISITNMGAENWVCPYEGPGDGLDEAYAVIYGDDGDIYAAGTSSGISTGPDFTIVGITNTGSVRWPYRYTEPENNMDVARDLVYGASNNIYAAGYRNAAAPPFGDIMVASLTNTGAENWLYWYDGPDSTFDNAFELVYDFHQNIYTVGYSKGSGTDYDVTVINHDTAGVEQWVYRYDGSDHLADQGSAIVYGDDGNIYAAGITVDDVNSNDIVVISLKGSTGITECSALVNPNVTLLQSMPDPFFKKYGTVITYSIVHPSHIKLRIYNSIGQYIKTLVDGLVASGTHSVAWRGDDDYGKQLSNGIYFCTLELNEEKHTTKIIMVE